MARPPGPVLLGAATVACGGALWGASCPGGDFFLLLLVGYAAVAIAIVWVLRTACHLALRRAGSGEARASWLRVSAVPVVIAMTLLAIGGDVPMRLRFAQARGAFEGIVRSIQEGRPAPTVVRLGTYRVRSVSSRGPNIYFVVDGGGFLTDEGFVYLPHGAPQKSEIGERTWVRHFGGDWYTFSADMF
ncbi:hypothetical protein [Mycobacteroides saopaulense]|uniref:hypothetical protein n=2 Tax=Mycobacteroides saopaulense TaxID=1578165 RepID=UPI0010425E22|nr:hypothetical protein [Mycobacteroides saopaulense]